jgi:hypothetical protein
MQAITLRVAASFARVPSIRFLGPRDQLKQHPHAPPPPSVQKQPTTHVQSHKASQTTLKDGPALKPLRDLEIGLEGWQIEAINNGGVIDLKYLKVKPISLRKK